MVKSTIGRKEKLKILLFPGRLRGEKKDVRV